MLMNTSEYKDTLDRVVAIVEDARARAVQSANAELVKMYWNIGVEINAHTEWGNKYIDSLSRDIRTAFPQIKGFQRAA